MSVPNVLEHAHPNVQSGFLGVFFPSEFACSADIFPLAPAVMGSCFKMYI